MYINAIGYYIPPKRISNEFFTQRIGVTDEWISQRTGIQTRSRASDQETIDFMCTCAVKQSLTRLSYNIRDVDLIVFASYTPADTVATTGHIIQRTFDIDKAKVFYISSACSSSMNAIEIIHSFFLSGKASKALLVCGERNSSYSNDYDKTSGHLWGDGAAAYFFSKEKHADHYAEIVDVITLGLGHIGMATSAITLNLKKKEIEMPFGQDVFINACNFMTENTKEIAHKNGWEISDLNYFIGHQANMQILKNVASQLKIPKEKVLTNIERLGNTGSVSTLLVFAENYERFKSGDLICISVFGGGYSTGTCLLKIN